MGGLAQILVSKTLLKCSSEFGHIQGLVLQSQTKQKANRVTRQFGVRLGLLHEPNCIKRNLVVIKENKEKWLVMEAEAVDLAGVEETLDCQEKCIKGVPRIKKDRMCTTQKLLVREISVKKRI